MVLRIRCRTWTDDWGWASTSGFRRELASDYRTASERRTIMASVSLRKVFKYYDNSSTPAVNDFNLEIEDKEFVVFVGPSGCGKSTTLRMIAGLEEISEGEIYIDDKLINDEEAKDRDIAMVFQNYALYPNMTVYGNMAFGLKLKRIEDVKKDKDGNVILDENGNPKTYKRKYTKQEIDEKVKEAAAILKITEYLDRKPKALSGGQRQRVAIGRAIVRKPKQKTNNSKPRSSGLCFSVGRCR